MAKRIKAKYRYFKKFNGVIAEAYTNDEVVANNYSFYSGKPYYKISSTGEETEVTPTHIMTDNLIGGGFHESITFKNKLF